MPATLNVGARQDEQLRERMRTGILQPRLQRRRRLQVGSARLGVTEARRQTTLPPSADGLRLHPAGRHRGRRARHGDAGSRVDDGDGVAGAGGRGLVELQGRLRLALIRRRDEGRRGGVKGEGRHNLGGLLSRGALRRVACQ